MEICCGLKARRVRAGDVAGPHHARQRGVSLSEGLVALSVSAVLVGMTIPSFGRMADRHRLEGAAAQMETTFQFARSAAVDRRQSVRVSFSQSNHMTCYVVHTGGARDCDCSGVLPTCKAGAEALASTRFDADSRLRLTSNSASMLIDAERGTVTPAGTVALKTRQGDEVRVVINIMGRIRMCSSTPMPGYKRC